MTSRNTKRILVLLLCAVMALGLCVATASADDEITTWAQLQTALDAGGTVTLTQDITAGTGDSALSVFGKIVVLDLNGYTIDRGLANSEAQMNGNVITNNGILTITDTSAAQTGAITGGRNTGSGGAIVNHSALTVSGGTITGNAAQEAGAVLNKTGSRLTITGGALNNNNAVTFGGGAIVNHGTISMSGGTVQNNTAAMNGGAIWSDGTLTITSGSVANNTAQQNGGAVYITGTESTAEISGGTISGNTAMLSGGAFIINGGTTTISGGTITGNRADGSHGGAIYVSGNETTLNLYGGTITGNTAAGQGGAILKYQDQNTVNIHGSPVITDNQAERGPNLYMRSGTGLLTVTGLLNEDARIGVTLAAGEGLVTYRFGLFNGPSRMACFIPDSQDYMAGVGRGAMVIYTEPVREVILGEPVTVSFLDGGGSGTMDSVTLPRGSMYILPECGFTPPEGGPSFICWNVNGDQKLPGDWAMIEADTAVVAVFHAGDVYYIERSWNGTKVVETAKVCHNYELLDSTNSSWYTIGQEGQTTWYVAQGNITMTGTTLTVRGNVNIILCDGANVQIKDGIEVKTGYSLAIYGQADGSGRLDARNNDGDAGIGCGPNSGVGDITIHGGVIEAHGGRYAAGIGSGDERQMGSHIRIYGGDIKAYGGAYGAGIGSGDETTGDNGYIDIYGGTVYAKGGIEGAGIGGGNEGNGRHITIWGGNVTAISGSRVASAIGGGDDGGGGTTTINGGVIVARSTDDGPCIGGDTNCGTIIINGGRITAISEKRGAGIGGAFNDNLLKGSITINGGYVEAISNNSAGIGAGGGTRISGGTQGGNLHIPITINGGYVKATGSAGSAGIGSGATGHVFSQIKITGGYVEATSKGDGAGIGLGNGGLYSDLNAKIIITGGTVIAQTDSNTAHAIGRGGDTSVPFWEAELYTGAKVTAGNSSANATVQTADNRVNGLTRKYAKIEPCDHTECTYTAIDDTKHKKLCTACGHEEEEAHSGMNCVCVYNNPIRTVTLNSLEGITNYDVHEGAYFMFPLQEGQIITGGNGSYLRVTGWQESGDGTGIVHAPGSWILVREDMSFTVVGDAVYGIIFAYMQHGSISTDQMIGDLTGAAVGETVSLHVTPDSGYRVRNVNYMVCAGKYPLLNTDTWEPAYLIEISPADGNYQFEMPNVSEYDALANTLLISAEFEVIPSFPITCADCANGTIGTDGVTGAREGETVSVYVKGNKGYEVSAVYVNGTGIEPSESGDYFFAMPAQDVSLTADFTPVQYTITYELNGGVNSGSNPGTYTVESATFALEAPTKAGYEFLGWYDDEFFKNDVVTQIEQGSTGDLTLYARFASQWSLLQHEIDNAAYEAVITLDQDYDAEYNDLSLLIMGGKKLTIDLNGHTLDANGKAIRIFEIENGDLTIQDSSGAGSGTMTGGDVGNSAGGAIIVRAGGTLTLNGGRITNCAASHGGAIALTKETSLFTMNGGTISYNSATHGGGVHVFFGTFVMNGGCIRNNSASGNGGGLFATQNADITAAGGRIEQNTADNGNVYLDNVGMKVSGDLYIESVYLTDLIITVTGSLAEDSKIGLTCFSNAANDGKTLTSGLNGYGTQENFFSAQDGYLTGLNPEGEIVMGTPVTVSFDSNGGSGVESQMIAKNSVAAEPEAPAKDVFTMTGWYQVVDSEGTLAETAFDFANTPITAEITLKAVWQAFPFGTPDFVIPAGTLTIEAGAFEGIAATIVEISANCTSIGDYAFRDCAGLTMIRVPAGCTLGTDVFDGCAKVYVFGAAGSPAEAYCQSHGNCVFVEDAQN